MARPVSWLPRLFEIRQSVAHSARTHYDRSDLQKLFQLQPRAAQKLLELFPADRIGTSHLVANNILAGFLDQVREAEDVAAVFAGFRQQKKHATKRKPRSLVRRDLEQAHLAQLPPTIQLSPGRLEVRFDSTEHLAEQLLMIARVLEGEGEEFARSFEPPKQPTESSQEDDWDAILAELQRQEVRFRRQNS